MSSLLGRGWFGKECNQRRLIKRQDPPKPEDFFWSLKGERRLVDIYNAVSHPSRLLWSRKKVEVGPEGTTCNENIIDGQEIPEGSPCYITEFDKNTGIFKGVIKRGSKEKI